MSRAFLSGLRGRLLLLVVLATLPAFALSYYVSWRDRQHQVGAVVGDTVRLARLVANDQERVIEGTRQILSDLAGIAEVRAGDAARTRTLFGLLMKQWRGYASFTLIDPAGSVIVSLPAPATAVSFAGRPWFERAVTGREFVVGEYQVGQVTGKKVVVGAWPVVENGALVSVIAAALDVAWLNEIASAARLPEGTVLQLVDRAGILVAAHPPDPPALGREMLDTRLGKRMEAQVEGSLQLTARDGSERVYAFTPVRGRLDTGLRLVIGVPRATAFGAIERNQSRQLLGVLMLALVTLTLAWAGAERLVLSRVASLLDATRKLAAGDRSARTSLPYGQGELSELAQAFDEMAGALQAREAERQHAEHALRESEERFRAFMDNTPAIAFVKDEAGRCLYANPAFERYFGVARDGWFGRTEQEIWPSSPSNESFRRDDLRVLATNQPHQSLETVPLGDGRTGYWMTVKFPLSDGSGRRLVGGVSVDLTAWRLAQAALARSERRYEQLVEQAWDGIVLVGPDRRILATNSAACAITGYTREELLESRVDDLLAAPVDRGTPPLSEGALGSGEVVVSELAARRKDGSTVMVEFAARRQDNGQVQAILRDVTARRAAERALRESEERYRLLYQHLPLAYQSLASDGTIIEVNDAWLSLTGLSREGAIGSRFDVLLQADGQLRFLESLARVARSGEVRDVEAVLGATSRSPVIVAIHMRHARDERGQSRVHCVLHDVTAARTAAARLRESEERYRSLFADNPVPLFEEDFSGIKRHLGRLEALGVTDFEAHFSAHPEELADCIEAVRVVDVNNATLALYRAESRSQLLAGLDRIIGQDGHAVFESAILALARGERSWKSRGMNYTLDGEPVALALQWSLAPGAEADWSRVIVSAVDLSEQARAEAARRESDTRFVRAFESSATPMAISTRAEGRFLEVNGAFERQFGYSRRELIGRTSTDLGLFAAAGTRQRLLAQLAAPGGVQNEEATFRRKDGRLVEGLCSGVPLPVDGHDCVLVQIMDITARKRAEETGRENRRMLETLMSNLPGMVYQCCNDPEFTMLFVSEGCRDLTGYEAGDLVGNRRLSYANLILDEDREGVRGEVQRAIDEQRPFRMVYRIRTAKGETRWVWEQGRVGQVTAGDIITLEGFIADITDRKRAEDELRGSAERMRQRSASSGGAEAGV